MATLDRTYLETHPQISFSVEWRRAPERLWLLLGEAKSKCEHVGGALLTPDAASELLMVFLTKGALATTAIEGNTLSEEEARRVIDKTIELPASKAYLGQEIENVLAANNQIKAEVLQGGHGELTPELIAEYNRLILRDLELDEGVVPGETRTYSVVVGNYRAAPAEDCDYLVDRLCEWLNGPTFEAPEPDLRAPYAIVKAVLAHLYFAWIHPFGDGNGRTARLLELQILLAAGFPAPTCQLLSNHYNFTRGEYYRQLHLAGRSEDVMPFLRYAVRGFVDGVRDQLQIIWGMQYSDRWKQYVYEEMGKLKTETDQRQLRLVLDLTKVGRPVERSELRHISPAIAEAYAGKTGRTVARDVNALLRRGLIVSTSGRYEPNSTLIWAFKPEQAEDGIAAPFPAEAVGAH